MPVSKANRLCLLCVLVMIPAFCGAQWVTQELHFEAGWNAIDLNIAPDPPDCRLVFTNAEVESVWRWNRRFSTVEFDQDAATPIAGTAHWLMWLPASHPEAFLGNLYSLQGGKSYLVKINDAAAPFSVTVKGHPTVPRIEWRDNAFNFVGFPVTEGNPPSFMEFFNHTSSIESLYASGGEIYRVKTDGQGQLILKTARYNIEAGAAYWIKSREPSDYVGPLKVNIDYGGEIDFGNDVTERSLTIKNVSETTTVTAQVERVASEQPPIGPYEELAGEVPLSYYRIDLQNNIMGWTNLSSRLTRPLAAGEEWRLRLAVRRGDMPPFSPAGTNGFAYQSILEITDNDGSISQEVGVRAEQ